MRIEQEKDPCFDKIEPVSMNDNVFSREYGIKIYLLQGLNKYQFYRCRRNGEIQNPLIVQRISECRCVQKIKNQDLRTPGAGRNELPAMAAKPPTNPPMSAVTSISKMDEPPNLNSSETL